VQEPQAPAEVSHRFAEAISAGDVDGALACWSPAAVIVADDGSEVRGRETLAERFRGLVAVGARMEVSVSDQVCTELGAIATTRMTLAVRAGREQTVIQAAGVVVYVPAPSGLQILIDRLRPQIA
jgi:ketosteroid isomerase-like protein